MLLVDRIKATVRDVHGYPKPGIVFKDITPLLSDPALVSVMVREHFVILIPLTASNIHR